ncbi:hypothetical protein D3C81_1939670 [compost metagenome]
MNVIAGHEGIGIGQCQGNEGRVGEYGTVVQSDRCQGTALAWGDGAYMHLVGHCLGDGDVAQSLPRGRGDGDGLGAGEVGPGDRFAFGHVHRLCNLQ